MKLAFKIIYGHQTVHYLNKSVDFADHSVVICMNGQLRVANSDYHEVEVEREVVAQHVHTYHISVGDVTVAKFEVGVDSMGLELGRVFPSFAIRNIIYQELLRIHG